MNRWTVALLSGAILCLPAAGRAQQGPGGPGDRGGRGGGFGPPPAEGIQSVLDLDERQLAELNELRDEYREQTDELREQVRMLEEERRENMKSGDADPVLVGSISLQIESLQTQMEQTGEQFRTEAMALLDSRQRETVEKIEEALELAPKARSLMQYGLIEMPGGRGGMFFVGGAGGPGGRRRGGGQ